MAKMKIKWNPAGFRALARSGEMLGIVQGHAQRIAAAAGDGFEVRASLGRNRARAVVIAATPEAQLAEATDKALTRAIGGV